MPVICTRNDTDAAVVLRSAAKHVLTRRYTLCKAVRALYIAATLYLYCCILLAQFESSSSFLTHKYASLQHFSPNECKVAMIPRQRAIFCLVALLAVSQASSLAIAQNAKDTLQYTERFWSSKIGYQMMHINDNMKAAMSGALKQQPPQSPQKVCIPSTSISWYTSGISSGQRPCASCR